MCTLAYQQRSESIKNVSNLLLSPAARVESTCAKHRHIDQQRIYHDRMVPMDISLAAPQSGRDKRSPVNRNVSLINAEQDARYLSRYPFHGNRAIPRLQDVHSKSERRWSSLDIGNEQCESQRMLVNYPRASDAKPSKQLTSARSHSSPRRITLNSPLHTNRFSNVYEYSVERSRKDLNSIYEDSDSQ